MQKYPVSPEPAGRPQLPARPELNRAVWDRVTAQLLAKMLGEFAYEEILTPLPQQPPITTDGTGEPYALLLDDGATLAFRARRGVYGSWRVDPASVRETPRPENGDGDDDGNGYGGAPPQGRPFRDPLLFLTRARGLLGLDGATLGHLVRELTSTLASDAHLAHTALGAAELADLGYAELEGHQTGHPWLVANKGRLGFSAGDAARFTPEARAATTLPWIAVSTRIAGYRGVPELATPDRLYARELDPSVRDAFEARLADRGLDPRAYHYLPVHPWQWDEWIVPLYAPAIAADDIVPLHDDGDLRLPQQSIRTFANVGRPERFTVKLPLSILNTLVWRGLPTERTLAAPAVTGWVQGLCDTDPFLRDTCAVILLGEVASVAVEHPLYDRLPEVPYQFKEILGAIWREPLPPRLAAGSGPAPSPPCCTPTPTAAPSPPNWSNAPGCPPRLAGPPLRRPAPAAPALPLPVRDRVLSARRERHRGLRRTGRTRAARDQGLRRRRQHQRAPAARARHHARGRARRPADRGTLLPHPVHPFRALRRRLPLSVAALRRAAGGSRGRILVTRPGRGAAPPRPVSRAQGPVRDVRHADAGDRAPLSQSQPPVGGRLPGPPGPPARGRPRPRPESAAHRRIRPGVIRRTRPEKIGRIRPGAIRRSVLE